MLDAKRGQVNLDDILVIKELHDVFPEELPVLPPKREIDLAIEVLPGTTPILFNPRVRRFYLLKIKMALSGCASIIDK